jgi:class 3 adenylate cyclase
VAEERVQRRLAAVLAADVVGYSRLMEYRVDDFKFCLVNVVEISGAV